MLFAADFGFRFLAWILVEPVQVDSIRYSLFAPAAPLISHVAVSAK